MGKIMVEIDSVIQTKEEIDDFTKVVVDIIKENLVARDVLVEINELGNDYDLKAYLPENQ